WIDLPADTSREALEAALATVAERHDVLRLRFRETGAGWVGQYGRDLVQDVLVEEDLSEVAPEWRSAFVADSAATAQASLDITQGRLCRWLWVHGDRQQQLLWVMHRIVVDNTSWRILIEDLRTALAGGELGPKTSSYQEWGVRVHTQAFDSEFEDE